MNRLLKNALMVSALAIGVPATAQVTFYQDNDFRGQSFTTDRDVENFQPIGFNDRASSVVVQRDNWVVCQDARFQGRCMILQPGRYPELSSMGLNDRISSVRRADVNDRVGENRSVPGPTVQDNAGPGAQITFYENDSFQGRAFTADRAIEDFIRAGFNDRASSIDVRGDNWVACEDARFQGRCVILQPGRYASLSATGLNNRISSVRRADVNDRVGDNRSVPGPIVQDNARPGAQITFYQNEGFQGQAFTADRAIEDFSRAGFNDRASSIDVRGDNWVACEDARFQGRCVILQPGRYPSLSATGLNDRISSVRRADVNDRVGDNRSVPGPTVQDNARPGAQITFYQSEGFQGRAFTADRAIEDFSRAGFNDRASSIDVRGDNWVACEDARFQGRCVILQPGRYPSLSATGLNDRISSVRRADVNDRVGDNRSVPGPIVQDNARPGAQITFYENDGFQGRTFTADRAIEDFSRVGFNDRASSIDVRGDNWVACEDARFQGRCMILEPGRYPELSSMGLNDRISSVRRADVNDRVRDNRNAPTGAYDYRRRGGEQTFEANVTSVRAVVGTPQQRCWVEREQISPNNTSANIPAALAGAVIGGILGHQIGGGSGKDAATALGVVGGAVVGANVGRDSSGQQVQTQDVRRCDQPVAQARPDYWDVTYVFRGREFRVQMVAPPGPTVTVNSEGEPRV